MVYSISATVEFYILRSIFECVSVYNQTIVNRAINVYNVTNR